MFNVNYNPDVLTCLASLSNDEVFTPPDIANRMLDQLPKELWSDKTITFLDPCTKSGIFLREITKRLLVGLENEIPNLNERIDHILTKQVFGIGITELTAQLSRRSLYCSRNANQKFSVTDAFENNDGNILYKNIGHKWKNLKCEFCGATKDLYNRKDYLEQYAYDFIHTNNQEELFNMKFDVIIGNPPYQLSTGEKAQATPLYDKFVMQALKLNPRYLTMIIPSRWFSGGFGLNKFREFMFSKKNISHLIDYYNSNDCFPGVTIRGGVNYFLIDNNYEGPCNIKTYFSKNETPSNSQRYLSEKNLNFFIRSNEGYKIYSKVIKKKESNFSDYVLTQKPFGLATNFMNFSEKKTLSNDIKLFTSKSKKAYVSKVSILKNHEFIDKFKIFISKAAPGEDVYPHKIITEPILGKPGSVCTETYLCIGPFDTENEANNAINYMKSKFFRLMLFLIKSSQDITKRVYSLVPSQNFKKSISDEYLYEKYNLDSNDINFIDKAIKSF